MYVRNCQYKFAAVPIPLVGYCTLARHACQVASPRVSRKQQPQSGCCLLQLSTSFLENAKKLEILDFLFKNVFVPSR